MSAAVSNADIWIFLMAKGPTVPKFPDNVELTQSCPLWRLHQTECSLDCLTPSPLTPLRHQNWKGHIYFCNFPKKQQLHRYTNFTRRLVLSQALVFIHTTALFSFVQLSETHGRPLRVNQVSSIYLYIYYIFVYIIYIYLYIYTYLKYMYEYDARNNCTLQILDAHILVCIYIYIYSVGVEESQWKRQNITKSKIT